MPGEINGRISRGRLRQHCINKIEEVLNKYRQGWKIEDRDNWKYGARNAVDAAKVLNGP